MPMIINFHWYFAHVLPYHDSYLNNMADGDGRQAFEDTLGRIGFAPAKSQAFITQSGCTNIAISGLLPSDQISKICKCWTMHA